MPEYRAYIIGPDRHFFSSVPLECADDAEATKQAEQLVDRRDVELWQRARKVVGSTQARNRILNNSGTSLYYQGDSVVTEKRDREEPQRRMEQARRMMRQQYFERSLTSGLRS